MTIQGDLSLRTFVDRDGQNRTSVQISASHVEFPGKRSAEAPAPAATASSGDDELPFM